jgi:YVTN family beta-propeller protein
VGLKHISPNAKSKNVTVIDIAAQKVIATIPVCSTAFGVAITPDGTKAYVTLPGKDTVSVIDTATEEVIASISVDGPFCIAMTPDGREAYVTQFSEKSCFSDRYCKTDRNRKNFRRLWS